MAGRWFSSHVWPAGSPLPGERHRLQSVPLERHVAGVEESQDTVGVRRVEAGGIEHHGVALHLRRLDDRLADVRPSGDDLLESRARAAEHHVDVVIDRLLGDGARAAVFLLGRSAVGHVRGTLAAAVVDVRVEHGRRRVGDFSGAHVAGLVTGALRQLENRRQVVSRHAPVPATLEIRPLLVLNPVAQPVPEAAESVT